MNSFIIVLLGLVCFGCSVPKRPTPEETYVSNLNNRNKTLRYLTYHKDPNLSDVCYTMHKYSVHQNSYAMMTTVPCDKIPARLLNPPPPAPPHKKCENQESP